MNQDRGDGDTFSVPYSAHDTVDRTDKEPELDGAGHGRNRGAFPLRTLMVCFTVWLIATQAMIFDQLKFDERAHLLERQARSFGVPQAVAPNEQLSNVPTGAKVQRL